MSKTEREHCQDIVEIGRIMWQKGWVAAQDGNISIRLDDDRILCTPTGVCKGLMKPEDLIVCDAAGTKIEGSSGCTTEIAMHVAIYRLRPDVRSVLHAHPPFATGFAVAGRALNQALLPEAIMHLGTVPVAAYGLPGTAALTEPMLPLIPNHDALLMANHGAVAYGQDVYQAFFHMETVEHLAHVTLVAELLGGAKALPRAEVAKLLAARARYGIPTRAGLAPDVPLAAEDIPDPDVPF
jgi:L-fuculose-phosphate aldolase